MALDLAAVIAMQKGDFVEIEYVGRIKESGEIFDLTDEELAKKAKIYNSDYKYGPLVVVVGAGHVLPGIDEKLETMDQDSEEKFEIPPEKAFGKRLQDRIKLFSLEEFRKQKVVPVVGQHITFYNGVRGKVISVSSGRVKVDFNHPLAGKTLDYQLKIGRKITDPKEQIDAVITFLLGSKGKFNIAVSGDKAEISAPQGAKLPEQVQQVLSGNIKKYVTSVKDVAFAAEAKNTQEKQ